MKQWGGRGDTTEGKKKYSELWNVPSMDLNTNFNKCLWLISDIGEKI